MENRILKSGTCQPDSGRMPLKVRQLVRTTTLPFQTMKAGVQIRLIPGQKAGRISDGSPTNGGVTGRNPATQTKQQTAQMPMNSTIAALTAQQSIAGGGGGIRTHGTFRLSSFQDWRNRPLYHPSGGLAPKLFGTLVCFRADSQSGKHAVFFTHGSRGMASVRKKKSRGPVPVRGIF